jgi:hypothetical protein
MRSLTDAIIFTGKADGQKGGNVSSVEAGFSTSHCTKGSRKAFRKSARHDLVGRFLSSGIKKSD